MGKILHVTTCYAGGVSRAINTAVRLTSEHEHHLLWAGSESPGPSHRFNSVTRFPGSSLRYVSAVNELVDEVHPDIIHAHSSWAGVVTRVAKRRTAKIIYEPHCYKFDDPDLGAFLSGAYKLVERLLANRSDVTVVLSPHEERLAKSLAPELLTHYVPNAPFVTSMAGSHVPGSRHVIMVGRLAAQKDPAFFAAVCREVRSVDPSVNFKWIGDGDTRHRVLLESSGVEITGWLDQNELELELQRSAIYLHTAKYEGFPLSILDAAAVGVPIIARRIDAIEETPIWQVENIQEATEAVLALLDNEAARSKARDAAQMLLDGMNENSQSRALSDLYSKFAFVDEANQISVNR